MARIFVLLILLTSNQCLAGDMAKACPALTKHQLIRLLALAGFATAAWAQVNTSEPTPAGFQNTTDTTTILATPFFIYWSTWLGNVYGIFDIIGWTTDWLGGYWFYRKSDTPKVASLKAQIRVHRLWCQERHQKETKIGVSLCDALIQHLEDSNSNTGSLDGEEIDDDPQSEEIGDDPEKPNLIDAMGYLEKMLDNELRELSTDEDARNNDNEYDSGEIV